jgi:hypothetical protein
VHFQLVTTDGDVLGTRELGRPDWPPGRVILTGPDEPNLRVVDVLATENDDPDMHFTVLVVEEV